LKIRDRIKEFRRVPASELFPNPKNWRTHPQQQQDALRGVLAEVGIADAVLARETEDGLMLIDGHLRAEVDPTTEWPVLVLDVTEEEADKILLTHDPLAAMAETNEEALAELLHTFETESPQLEAMFDEMLDNLAKEPLESATPPPEATWDSILQVAVECESEEQQGEVFEMLTAQGYRCKVLTL